MSTETEQLRMDVAQDRFDDARKDLREVMREFQLDVITRHPDQDDWDDTLTECAGGIEEATRYLQLVREKYREGS
jgi:hypothetical protein